MKFGEFLKEHRKKKDLKLFTAAQLLGISSSYLCSLECGMRPAPSFELLQRTAELLELSPKERGEFFDLAAETKCPPVLADDLNEYIYQNPVIRDLLRCSMERQLEEKDWENIFTYIKQHYF